MKRKPPIFDAVDEDADARRHAEATADVATGRVISNDEICAWLETWGMPDERPPPDSWFALHPVDDAADEAAMARGEADIAAGRVISHQAMKAWMLSWGTDHELPPPQVGD